MKIAFLCKRRYMSKDVIEDRYARLYELPHQLALLGHDVSCFCVSYQGQSAGGWEHPAAPGRLRWYSVPTGVKQFYSALTYPWKILRQLRVLKPDVIVAASDIPHIVLGAWLAKKLHLPYVADLYDNFEGFAQARIPGFVPALRWGVRQASLVTTTSEPLRELVVENYGAVGEVISMPSTIDQSVFFPRDKRLCREALGLPVDAVLVGTAGGLHRNKGIHTLYNAWPILADMNPEVHLVLAGPLENNTSPLTGERVHYLGHLPHARIAELFCALDVGIVCIPDTPFGRFCFPQKAYEMLACNLPIVAADIGAMSGLLKDFPQNLYRVDDACSLAEVLQIQVESRVLSDVVIDNWAAAIGRLESRVQKKLISRKDKS